MYLLRFVFLALVLSLSGLSSAYGQRLLIQSTTSTQNSGLYDYLLPIAEKELGIDIDVVAVGTGQAIKNAVNGDADVLLVHAKPAELKFIADGYGIQRFDLMYNDFVLIGPASDPEDLAGAADIDQAMQRLGQGKAPFVSRGDDSGTHKKELALWKDAGVSHDGQWYRDAGTGMGATIRIAVEMNGYTLSDRATWIAFQHKMDHKIVYAGDKGLFNQYGIIAVDPKRHPHVNIDAAQKFIDWMLSEHGQNLIAEFRVDGQQLFFPNAAR